MIDSRNYDRWMRLDKLHRDFDELDKITDKWAYIRQAYMECLPEILVAASRGASVDPYIVDWTRYFSPIEDDAWQSIRGRGLPMYPQFPVFNWFIDFADPYRRIGIEIDGKEWHALARDRPRDQFLATYGWRVFRVTGREAFRPFDYPADVKTAGADPSESVKEWLFRTCDGVVAAIAKAYYGIPSDFISDDECWQTLDRHRLADFPLSEEQCPVA